MSQLGKKIGNASLTKRALFSLGFADAAGGAAGAAFFAFFAAMAGEAAIAAIRTASANFFIVLIPLLRRRIPVAIGNETIARSGLAASPNPGNPYAFIRQWISRHIEGRPHSIRQRA